MLDSAILTSPNEDYENDYLNVAEKYIIAHNTNIDGNVGTGHTAVMETVLAISGHRDIVSQAPQAPKAKSEYGHMVDNMKTKNDKNNSIKNNNNKNFNYKKQKIISIKKLMK